MQIIPADIHDLQGGSLRGIAALNYTDPTTRYSQVLGVGTAYTLTTSAAAVTFGTTSPSITLPGAGTYKLSASVQLDRAGMTITNQTASLVFRRTNNTAADLGSTVTIDLPVSTTLTDTLGTFVLPELIYNTVNAGDVITIFAAISGALGAGTLTAIALGTQITAIKLS